ncbi:DUF503 domain-containing protein [Salininema proteolyticum]|uniref:DUF503 domain-containing protein n=1 Tax=Salininema proteolyticum TaxID=1607685 RepID=A0ABV8U0W7_9ACTN
MFCGTLEFDILLPGDSQSLKAKRAYVRPLVALLRKYDVAVSEVGDHDLYGRARIGAAAVAGDNAHVAEVLDRCERAVAGRVEVQLLSTRRRVFGPEDE